MTNVVVGDVAQLSSSATLSSGRKVDIQYKLCLFTDESVFVQLREVALSLEPPEKKRTQPLLTHIFVKNHHGFRTYFDMVGVPQSALVGSHKHYTQSPDELQPVYALQEWQISVLGMLAVLLGFSVQARVLKQKEQANGCLQAVLSALELDPDIASDMVKASLDNHHTKCMEGFDASGLCNHLRLVPWCCEDMQTPPCWLSNLLDSLGKASKGCEAARHILIDVMGTLSEGLSRKALSGVWNIDPQGMSLLKQGTGKKRMRVDEHYKDA
eukprot:6480818-Amphidinium_carterae.1